MKYQIYLNKESSDYINIIAKHENKKPNTLIKELLESMLKVAIATAEETNNQIKLHDSKKG